MSRKAVLTLLGTTLSVGSIVYIVHATQKAELEAMYQGVVNDEERMKIRKERTADFEMQQKLQKEYEKYQSVSNNTDGNDKKT